MFRLYHDEDSLDSAVLAGLRRAGFDCLTASEAGLRGRTDESQLTFAAQNGRVLFSSNTVDFTRLDAQWRRSGRSHAGIVVLTDQRLPVGAQIRAFQAMGARFSSEDMLDRLEFLLNHL